jgi:GNAT superfamily N-acetyltransferase
VDARAARIREISLDDVPGLEAHLKIRNAVTPDSPDSIVAIRWESETYPGEATRFLAEDAGGAPVGTATTGRIWMHERDYERFWLGIWVVPEARGQGVGSALYAATSAAARAAGKTGFQTELSEAHADGHRWFARRGFVETDRDKIVRLDLAGAARPSPALPVGFRLVTLGERPDLLPGVHAAALETLPDVPTSDEPISVGTLEAFAARDVDQPDIPKDAFFLALDEATGAVAGYASLVFAAGSTTLAHHDMTAVRRAYRGRGIARALKEATIAWAMDHGLEALQTGNDINNAPMRAINAALGYRPMPDRIGLQGPLAQDR